MLICGAALIAYIVDTIGGLSSVFDEAPAIVDPGTALRTIRCRAGLTATL
jgi:hypothetical protein